MCVNCEVPDILIACVRTQAESNRTKESMSGTTHRFCRHCDITSADRETDFTPLRPHSKIQLTTAESYLRDRQIVQDNPELSKWLGVNPGGAAFDGLPNYDPVG